MNDRLQQGELVMEKGTASKAKPAFDAEIVSGEQSLARQNDRPTTVEDLMAKAIERGDTATMEKLFEMRREMRTESAEMAFNAAMTKAQKETKQVAADASNPQTRSRYATYKALDKMLRPIYTANGFALSFNTSPDAPAEYIRILCDVSHEAGFSKRFQIDMPADGKGAKGGDVMTKTHAVGAGAAYGMRYLLKMIFNVAIGEEDNDGNGPVSYEAITPKQVADLKVLMEEVGQSMSGFLKWAQVDKLEEIRASEYPRCVRGLEAKRK